MNAFVDDATGQHVLVDAGAEDLRTYPWRGQVRWLKLIYLKTTDLRELASWEQLVDLETEVARLERLDGLEHLSQLRHLNVSVRAGKLDLDALRVRPELVSFGLFPADGVADLTPLRHLERLRDLAITHEDPTFAQRLDEVPFAHLSQLERVRWRADWQHPGSLDDLSPLSALTQLRYLEFDALVVTCPLDVLLRLPNLREVSVTHPDAAAERERFAASRPDVRVAISEPIDRDAPLGDELEPFEIFADGETWWVLSGDLTERFGLDTNYHAEEQVKAAVHTEAPELARHLEFDTEADAFCVRSTRLADLQAIRSIIDALTDDSAAN
jgi:hypothetical protein